MFKKIKLKIIISLKKLTTRTYTMSIIIKSSSINADFYVNKSLDYRPIAYTQCMIP